MRRPKYYVGIDISSASFTAAAGTTPWKVVIKAAEFENTTDGFVAFMDWMKERSILADNAVLCMEATGVYWMSIYEFLDDQEFDVVLVNSRNIKNVSGRKTDVKDAELGQMLTIIDNEHNSPCGAYALADIAETICYEILICIHAHVTRIVH